MMNEASTKRERGGVERNPLRDVARTARHFGSSTKSTRPGQRNMDTCPMAPTSSWAYLTRHLDESPSPNNGLFRNWAQRLYRFRFSPLSQMIAD
jgi:hypothetical protein